MTTMNHTPISKATDLELLRELINRNGTQVAPTKSVRHVPFTSTIIAVGKDDVAEIVMPKETLDLVLNPKGNVQVGVDLAGPAKKDRCVRYAG